MKLWQWFGWQQRPGNGSCGRVMAEAKHPVRPATVSAEELSLLSASKHPSLIDEDAAVFKVELDGAGTKARLPMFPFFPRC